MDNDPMQVDSKIRGNRTSSLLASLTGEVESSPDLAPAPAPAPAPSLSIKEDLLKSLTNESPSENDNVKDVLPPVLTEPPAFPAQPPPPLPTSAPPPVPPPPPPLPPTVTATTVADNMAALTLDSGGGSGGGSGMESTLFGDDSLKSDTLFGNDNATPTITTTKTATMSNSLFGDEVLTSLPSKPPAFPPSQAQDMKTNLSANQAVDPNASLFGDGDGDGDDGTGVDGAEDVLLKQLAVNAAPKPTATSTTTPILNKTQENIMNPLSNPSTVSAPPLDKPAVLSPPSPPKSTISLAQSGLLGYDTTTSKQTASNSLAQSGLLGDISPASATIMTTTTTKKTNTSRLAKEEASIFSQSSTSKFLASMTDNTTFGGGLFDEVDAEEERKQEEERKRKEEELRREQERIQQEQLRIEQEKQRRLEEEQRRQLEEEQRRQRQIQQQKEQEELRKKQEEERMKQIQLQQQQMHQQVLAQTGGYSQTTQTIHPNGNSLVGNPYVTNGNTYGYPTQPSVPQPTVPVAAPPSSFYRTHEPQIIMDDPLSNMISKTNNIGNDIQDNHNMMGRYNTAPYSNISQPNNTTSYPSQTVTVTPSSQSLHQPTIVQTPPKKGTNASYQERSQRNQSSYQERSQLNNHYQQQQQYQHQQPQPQKQTLSPLAGMFNSQRNNAMNSSNHNSNTQHSFSLYATPPPEFEPIYGDLMVNDPRLVKESGLFGSPPPHWTYNVSTLPKSGHSGAVISVRRRFRHFVALEDRLREACPGAILPPRPDKHEARIIEEGLQQQSPQFAEARAQELETYLNNLAQHPYAGKSEPLRLFLTLPGHIGAAWAEVSSNAITRFGHVSTNAAVKVAENTNRMTLKQFTAEMGEDNAALLAMATAEHLRLTAVVQSVVKIEGFIHQTREYGDRAMFTGLETSKLCSSHLQQRDPNLAVPLSLLATGMMRSGKRTKHLSLQLSAAFGPFIMEYRQVKNERMAFNDRKVMLLKREAARAKAAEKSSKLIMHQRTLQMKGDIRTLEKLEFDAATSDESHTDLAKESDEIGNRLAGEVTRLTLKRRKEWMESLKIMASGFKESSAESAAIWRSLLSNMDGSQHVDRNSQTAHTAIHNNHRQDHGNVPDLRTSHDFMVSNERAASSFENRETVVSIPGATYEYR